MVDQSIVTLVSSKTDADVAKEVRAELLQAFAPILAIMDRAKADGLSVGFNISLDQYGRNVVKEITVVKPL